MNSYDIETFKKNGLYVPYCVCFILNNKNYSLYYNNSDDIISDSINIIFNNISKETIIYVHNIKFDSAFIINSISKNNKYRINCVAENKQVYALTLKYKKKQVTFRCSYKLLPLSLESIANGFNINKKIDYPYEFVNDGCIFWENTIDLHYFKTLEGKNYYDKFSNLKSFTINYCLNDCHITKNFVKIIYNVFKKELKINILNKNILSAPSLSYYIFYKKFNCKKIDKKIKKEAELYIRESYFGGRCEVFGNALKHEKVYHFDFSGMYGLCMKEKNVYGEPSFHYNVKNLNKLAPGFYNIDWESNLELPVLPHHNMITNKLLFTNGRGNGTYWFEEIELFKQMGGKIIKINSALIYPKTDYIFNDFVEYFEKFRKINDTYKTLAKLMVNSFYGRTGLRPKEEISFFIHNKEEFNEIMELSNRNELIINSLEEINNIWFITIELSEKSIKLLNKIGHSIKKEKPFNIAIASSITAKARIKLYNAFLSVQKNGGRLLYCDTDSVIAAFNRNVDNERHGEIFWDSCKKDTIIKDSVFIAPKTYSLKYANGEVITKIKGIKRNYLSLEELKTSFFLKKDLTVYNIEQIKNTNFKIEYRNINKNIDLIGYDKRKFTENLNYTKPLTFDEGKYF